MPIASAGEMVQFCGFLSGPGCRGIYLGAYVRASAPHQYIRRGRAVIGCVTGSSPSGGVDPVEKFYFVIRAPPWRRAAHNQDKQLDARHALRARRTLAQSKSPGPNIFWDRVWESMLNRARRQTCFCVAGFSNT
jgi:hypothetical protein